MEKKQITIPVMMDSSEDKSLVRQIKGYASVFHNIDSYGDIIIPGAFLSSIEAHKKRPIKLFSSHELDAHELIGTVVSLTEDSKGLLFEALVSSAPSAQDLAIKAKEGHLNEVSIGFFVKEFSYEDRDGEKIRIIKDLELVEISLVSIAANPLAQVLEVKNKNLEVKMSELDEMKKMMEEKLAQFEKMMNEPVNKLPQPAVETKSVKKEIKKSAFEIKKDEEAKHIEAAGLFLDHMQRKLSKSAYEDALETKALSSVVVENGGALIPERLHSEIVQKLDRLNRISNLVTVLPGNGPLNILDYSFDPTWAAHDDADTISATTIASIFGKSTLDPQDFVGLVRIPARLERRSFASIQPLISGDFARAYRDLKEDKMFVGTGNREPLGISTLLTALAVNIESVTAVANLDVTALVNCQFKLNEEYRSSPNCAWAMRPEAISKLRKLSSSATDLLWTGGNMQQGQPLMLLGYPVYETRGLDDGASSGEIFVVFGDFSKYVILEEVGFSIQASSEESFASNQIALRFVVSFDGMPVDKNAFAGIKMA